MKFESKRQHFSFRNVSLKKLSAKCQPLSRLWSDLVNCGLITPRDNIDLSNIGLGNAQCSQKFFCIIWQYVWWFGSNHQIFWKKIIRHFNLIIHEKVWRWSDNMPDDFEQIIRHFAKSSAMSDELMAFHEHCNGLLRNGTIPLPDTMLAYPQKCSVAYIWQQFHKNCSWTWLNICVWRCKITTNLPVPSELNT